MFVVTLVANELVAWMRRQPGTAALRALFYMDEIFGYFPPTAMPPSKLPMLTLMKQARAFGLGVVFATQNPVDLDYKGLSNAGTWFIGRLQTERDRDRVIDGLLSAQAGADFDRAALAKLMAGIAPRVFLMRNVNDDAPTLFRTRWALSWLRGPLTLPEITRLMSGRKPAESSKPAAAAESPAKSTARPALPSGVEEVFLAAKPGTGDLVYRPRIVATAELHYADKPAGIDTWTRGAWLAPLGDGDGAPDWSEAATVANLDAVSAQAPLEGATFAELPAPALAARNYAEWSKALAASLYQNGAVELLSAKSLKLTSNPGESEGDFRTRLAQGLRELRDREVAKLREKHAAKLKSLDERLHRAADRVEREKAQYTQRKLDTAISIGTSVLGAIFGGRSAADDARGIGGALRRARIRRARRRRARGREPRVVDRRARRAAQGHRAGSGRAHDEPRSCEHHAREASHRAAQVRHRDRARRNRMGTLARRPGRLSAPGLDIVKAAARSALALLVLFGALLACSPPDGPPLGLYRAVVSVEGGDLPLRARARRARTAVSSPT